MILYVNFDVKSRKFELIFDFWICCSRICSWNLFLKLKFCSQCLQVIFEQLICFVCFRSRIIDENWAKHSTHKWYCDENCETSETNVFVVNSIKIIENAHAKSRSKFCMIMKIWFLNHANAKFRKYLNNKSNTFCFRYWCWICWKCCKKFIILLYKSNFRISHMKIESKISISTKIDVDFDNWTFCWICSINSACFFVFHLIWHSINLISRCVCFWIFCSINWVFFCLKNSIVKIFAFVCIWDCNFVNSISNLIFSIIKQSKLWYDL